MIQYLDETLVTSFNVRKVHNLKLNAQDLQYSLAVVRALSLYADSGNRKHL